MKKEDQFHVVVETEIAYFVCCYFKPDSDLELIFETLVETLLKLDLDRPCIIGGDFNCRLDKGERGTDLRDFLRLSFALECLNSGEVTYDAPNGSSEIDLIFTNDPCK